MTNGLNIDIGAFKKLPTKQQMVILYENTEELKSMISGYKFHQKVQYLWLGALSALVGVGKYLGII